MAKIAAETTSAPQVKPALGSTAAPEEIAHFAAIAEQWWDPTGDFKPLHKFNPARLAFLRDRLAAHFGRDPKAERPFEGLTLIDIGCGGGLIAEPMARLGFTVTGIDAGEKNIGVAKVHAAAGGLDIDYRVATPEQLNGESFDVVLAMEVIEHVADPETFMNAVAALAKPGAPVFAATINRSVKGFALAIIGAEYILRWLPRGTHDWRKFFKPAELARLMRNSGIVVRDMRGFSYSLTTDEWRVTDDLDVNYAIFGVKE
ncbi:bifunctional 2-polyprenyl-6-hydroxyphenol methylase/3-demethylubiquinol 3-O-methyltransferase UbiG [Telmatospirillum sp. J64-1]|uniref:bifunctional 2-polyprenyl-6-hydroxyphenol methylase/3-demethylubiquinol 3-O-methyltransferase UbiG n=1 Tax=Telmatospirillum sp. J64-1 TaxID=2502183 RepID=UPI00115EBEF0|nr:bifunctional 2-polyprenyl-6-hydroxyphenol methylase/3-demethylubiquinol 3-O-methyltransferase UbiG [Telmatospirillum sp. J64-1]